MELGTEFAFSYERLNEIADDLIAGNDVNLDYYSGLKNYSLHEELYSHYTIALYKDFLVFSLPQ